MPRVQGVGLRVVAKLTTIHTVRQGQLEVGTCCKYEEPPSRLRLKWLVVLGFGINLHRYVDVVTLVSGPENPKLSPKPEKHLSLKLHATPIAPLLGLYNQDAVALGGQVHGAELQ